MEINKALRIGGRVLTVLLAVFTAGMVAFTILAVTTFDKEGRGLFGYQFYSALSDSMKSTFRAGDVVVSKKAEAALEAGAIITFKSVDPANYGEVVTHQIKEVTTYDGKPAYITFGAADGAVDAYPALAEKVLGVYQFRIPKAGHLYSWLKSPAGYFLLIFLPFLLLILLEGLRFFLLMKRYKKEGNERLDRQNAALEDERRQAKDTLEELERLRAEMKKRTDKD